MRDELGTVVARDALAHAILPALLHRLNNATQILSSLSSLAALDDRGEILATRADDLAYASAQVDDLGWVLAVFGSACGAQVLLARREPAGLAPLIACVRDGLRRNQRSLAAEARALPALAPGVADGWQLPWSIAEWLWISARSLAPGTELLWDLSHDDERSRLVCQARWSAEHTVCASVLSGRLPQLRCVRHDTASTLEFPGAWLSTRGSA